MEDRIARGIVDQNIQRFNEIRRLYLEKAKNGKLYFICFNDENPTSYEKL